MRPITDNSHGHEREMGHGGYHILKASKIKFVFQKKNLFLSDLINH